MNTTYDANHLRSLSTARMLDFDPDSGSEVIATLNPDASEKCVQFTGFRRFLFGIMRSVGTGGITSARIIASTNAAGTGSPTTVVAHAAPTPADAVGDTIWLECDDAQIHEVLPGATYVGLAITLAISTDECVISVRLADNAYSAGVLTVDYIS